MSQSNNKLITKKKPQAYKPSPVKAYYLSTSCIATKLYLPTLQQSEQLYCRYTWYFNIRGMHNTIITKSIYFHLF